MGRGTKCDRILEITHMVAPETIRVFELRMELLIAETTFKNISELYL